MSADLVSLKQQNYTAILGAFGEITQTRVAERAGLDKSAVTRMKESGQLEQFALILAACNLTVTPRTYVAIDPDELRALKTLVRKAMEGEGFGA